MIFRLLQQQSNTHHNCGEYLADRSRYENSKAFGGDAITNKHLSIVNEYEKLSKKKTKNFVTNILHEFSLNFYFITKKV